MTQKLKMLKHTSVSGLCQNTWKHYVKSG